MYPRPRVSTAIGLPAGYVTPFRASIYSSVHLKLGISVVELDFGASIVKRARVRRDVIRKDLIPRHRAVTRGGEGTKTREAIRDNLERVICKMYNRVFITDRISVCVSDRSTATDHPFINSRVTLSLFHSRDSRRDLATNNGSPAWAGEARGLNYQPMT